jgi:chromosome partitioning protein
MKVITFVSQKGGAGKTTLAASTGVYAHERGFRVCLMEMDKQGSLKEWHVEREKMGLAEPDFLLIETSSKLKPALAALKDDFDLVIIDTKGEDSPLTGAAIGVADFCVVPTRPLGVDLRACLPTIRSILISGKPFCFVLNQAPTRSKRVDDTQKALATLGIVSDVVLIYRLDHADAAASGYGITEYREDSAAAGELRSFWHGLELKVGLEAKEAGHVEAA